MRNAVVEEDLSAILAAPLDWSRLEGATIVVTGAAGVLPAYMVETVLARNESAGGRPSRSSTGRPGVRSGG